MKSISLEQLLEAGCHFGHQVTRGNPKSRDFVFEARDGIHIIDLAKTKEGLEAAGAFTKNLAKNPNSNIVIVGTKRQAQEILKKEIERVRGEITFEKDGLYFVTNKWIGGLLTNFSEISKNFQKLTDLQHKLNTKSEQAGFTKKEIGDWRKGKEKLEVLYGGVYQMKKEPDALFIIDSHLEALAVAEAMKMGIPTVAITDTNSDPALVDYPIPANDDAAGSLELIIGYILDAWKEGRNSAKIEKPKEEKTKKTDSKNVGAKVKMEENTPHSKSSGQALKKTESKESKEKKQ